MTPSNANGKIILSSKKKEAFFRLHNIGFFFSTIMLLGSYTHWKWLCEKEEKKILAVCFTSPFKGLKWKGSKCFLYSYRVIIWVMKLYTNVFHNTSKRNSKGKLFYVTFQHIKFERLLTRFTDNKPHGRNSWSGNMIL